MNNSNAVFQEIAEKQLRKYSHLPADCQMRQIIGNVVDLAISHAVKRGYTPDRFDDLLDEGISFVRGMIYILNPLHSELGDSSRAEAYRKRLTKYQASKNPDAWIWTHCNPRLAFESGESSGHYWPLDTDELANICDDYLHISWLQCGAIDRILVDAMIYQTALDFGEFMKPLLLGGGFIAIAISAMSKGYSKARITVQVMNFIWGSLLMLFAVFVGLAAGDFHGWWIGLLAGFGFWVLLKISWLLNNFEQIRNTRVGEKLLREMQTASDMMQRNPLSPSYVKDRLNASNNMGIVWQVGIFPILESAVSRNSVLWE